MEISFSSNSVTDDYIATKFGTCHDSPAVVSCAKYCSDNFFSIWMRAKWNFHHIWIVMEKLLVKWVPVQHDIVYTKQQTATGHSSDPSPAFEQGPVISENIASFYYLFNSICNSFLWFHLMISQDNIDPATFMVFQHLAICLYWVQIHIYRWFSTKGDTLSF